MSTRPEWLLEGAEVALHKVGNVSGRRVMYATVLRIGKRDVVLEDQDRNERRINVNTLRESGGSTWGPTTYLKAADDPAVTRDANKDRRTNTKYQVERALAEWCKTDDDTHPERAVAALRDAIRWIEPAE